MLNVTYLTYRSLSQTLNTQSPLQLLPAAFPTRRRILISFNVTFNERNSFYQQNHDAQPQLLIEERRKTSDPPTEKIQQGSQLIYVYVKPSGSQNEEVECVQNYSKAPTYTQAHTRQGKTKETNFT